MAYDGSGTFNRPVADYVYDTVISETDMNTEMAGIATGLTNCITRDGQSDPTADLPMATYKHTGVGNASARTNYAAAGQVQDGAFTWCGTAGGTADAITLTPTPAITAYAAGQKFRWKASANSNTGAATVVISGLASPKALQINDAALTAGQHAANKYYEGVYDGAAFQIWQVSDSKYADPLTTRGDVLVRNASNVTDRLAVGTANQALVTDGTDVAWGAVVRPAVTSNLTVGYTTDEYAHGTISSGTVTVDLTVEGVQTLTNNGAFTLAPPASGAGHAEIWVTNDASAGAITTSGFTKVTGDTYATTNAKKYLFQIAKSSVGSVLNIVEVA